jgi:hypothetical protein
MPLYAISGVSGIGAKTAKAPKGVKRPIVARIALAPARGSFLLLVGLNFMGLATKLSTAFKNKKDATNTFWSKLGGNTNELLRKTEQGAKKKRIFGEYISEGTMGVVPAAAASAAAPILVKVASFLKSINIDPAEIANAGKKVLANQIRAKLEPKELAATQAQEVAQMQTDQAVETLTQDKVSPSGLIPVTTEQKSKMKLSSKKYLPYLVGGGLALYLLTRKK